MLFSREPVLFTKEKNFFSFLNLPAIDSILYINGWQTVYCTIKSIKIRFFCTLFITVILYGEWKSVYVQSSAEETPDAVSYSWLPGYRGLAQCVNISKWTSAKDSYRLDKGWGLTRFYFIQIIQTFKKVMSNKERGGLHFESNTCEKIFRNCMWLQV